jgi:hypothetical protein
MQVRKLVNALPHSVSCDAWSRASHECFEFGGFLCLLRLMLQPQRLDRNFHGSLKIFGFSGFGTFWAPTYCCWAPMPFAVRISDFEAFRDAHLDLTTIIFVKAWRDQSYMYSHTVCRKAKI